MHFTNKQLIIVLVLRQKDRSRLNRLVFLIPDQFVVNSVKTLWQQSDSS